MIRALSLTDFDSVHRAFLNAFSDYPVPMQMARSQLSEMLRRRGYVPELSAGCFDGDELVAFTLTGASHGYAYDTGTGVLPSHRRNGLGRQMMDFVLDRLRDAGYTKYRLEVIESNDAAVTLYLRSGFAITRSLQCWQYDGPAGHSMQPIGLPDWELLRSWWDVEPSWQNSTESLHRAGDPFHVVGDADGYCVVFPSTGDVPQLAVRPGARRRGLGRRLLQSAATLAGKPLRLLNVDAHDPALDSFLETVGAHRTVRQLEMERTI